jgi:soluble lytic murein transglycosylase
MPSSTAKNAILCAAALTLACWASAAGADPGDADFIAARDAYRAGDSVKLERIAPRLQGYLLEPYVAYWRLKLNLDNADPAQVRAFIDRYADMPLSDRLRIEWLKSLGKRGDWAQFGQAYVKRSDEDVELGCYAAQWRQQRDGDEALEDARKYWFSGQDQPESCRPVFVALLATGRLTANDVWTRFRLAHEAGNYRLAARVAAELPAGEQPAPREIDRTDRSARALIVKGDFRFSARFGRELALYALDRVAAVDAIAAHDAWAGWRSRMPESDRLYGNLLVAYSAARQLQPAANDWYREAEGASMTEAQRAWRVRAALRAGSWSDVVQAIDAMPEAEAQDAAWRYWKARALAVTGRGEDATRLYASLATETHFYGLLAAEALGAKVEPPSNPVLPHPAELAVFGARPAVQRVVKLSSLDLRPEGQREWVAVVRGLDDESLLLAAIYAQRQGLYDRSINTADRTRQRNDFGLRYPLAFRSEIGEAARVNSVDPALVYGLIRQESRFVSDIVSSAGAVGLMQLMGKTARDVARRMGYANPRALKLDDPTVNTQVGTHYLRSILDTLGEMPVLAIAAYNAGPGRARAWRGASLLEGAVYAETIPFNETRDYVKKVLANTMFYQIQLGLPYVALKERLGVIPPRGASIDNGAILPDSSLEPADRSNPQP